MAKTSAERQAASMAKLRARAAERDTLATDLEAARAELDRTADRDQLAADLDAAQAEITRQAAEIAGLREALAHARETAQPFDTDDLERALTRAIERHRYT